MDGQINGSAKAGYGLQGDLTYDTVQDLFQQIEKLDLADMTSVDLASIDRIDSAGLALLLEWTYAAKKKQKTLVLKNAPASLESLIDVSGLQEALNISGR